MLRKYGLSIQHILCKMSTIIINAFTYNTVITITTTTTAAAIIVAATTTTVTTTGRQLTLCTITGRVKIDHMLLHES